MEKEQYKTRVENCMGLRTVVPPECEAMRYVHMDFLRLAPGERCVLGREDREIGFVILGGDLSVTYGDGLVEEIRARKDEFSGLPHAVYVPAGKTVEICARTWLEGPIYGTPAEKRGEVGFIRPKDIDILHIGEGNWEINGYFVIGSDFPAQRLIIGETQIPAGHWCSVPPHSHEKDVPGKETKLEEIYFFRFRPRQGFGFQGLYTDDRSLDDGYIIRSDDVILVSRGYHPNVAGPGYEMRMLWGMGGDSRAWIPYEDPDHSWIGNNSNAPADLAWGKEGKE